MVAAGLNRTKRLHSSRNIHSKQSSLYTSHLMIKVYQYLGKIYLFKDNSYDRALHFFTQSEKMAANWPRWKKTTSSQRMCYYKGRCYDGKGEREKRL